MDSLCDRARGFVVYRNQGTRTVYELSRWKKVVVAMRRHCDTVTQRSIDRKPRVRLNSIREHLQSQYYDSPGLSLAVLRELMRGRRIRVWKHMVRESSCSDRGSEARCRGNTRAHAMPLGTCPVGQYSISTSAVEISDAFTPVRCDRGCSDTHAKRHECNLGRN